MTLLLTCKRIDPIRYLLADDAPVRCRSEERNMGAPKVSPCPINFIHEHALEVSTRCRLGVPVAVRDFLIGHEVTKLQLNSMVPYPKPEGTVVSGV